MQGLLIAGTHSGCGKTTVTLGILAALTRKGCRVQPFKAGPDFIDTGLHRLATGRPSRNLDVWMCGADYVTRCFMRHSRDADIAVVEGVMGLYDGETSTAHLSAVLGLPVVLVVDAGGMAESAGAVVRGFVDHGSTVGTDVAGVILNRIGSERHYRRAREGVRDVPVLGYLPRDLDFEIPHRHLGLVVAEERPITPEGLDKLADAASECIDTDRLIQDPSFKVQDPAAPAPEPAGPGGSVRIGVARDRAFCFYYQDNLDLLGEHGVEIAHFSPLSDRELPDGLDALYIGGGYPELYAEELSANSSMIRAVSRWAEEGRPLYAECGGFMYLTEGIHDPEGRFHPMTAVFPLVVRMTRGRVGLGYREITLKERSLLGEAGTVLRGHEFHYSEIARGMNTRAPESRRPSLIYSVRDGSGNRLQDEGYRVRNALGSYVHIHFGSNPAAAGNFARFIKERRGDNTACRARKPQG